MNHCSEELTLIALLKEALSALSCALNSLAEKTPPTVESYYVANTAKSVLYAADGYLFLRESGRVPASKILVRPILEATVSAAAVVKQKGFLFRKLFTEFEDSAKMFAKEAGFDLKRAKELEELKNRFLIDEPNYPIECKKVNARDTAEVAGMLTMYEIAFRTYCEFSHGTSRAVSGDLDAATDLVDTSLVSCCVMTIMGLMKDYTPATVVDLSHLAGRINAASIIR